MGYLTTIVIHNDAMHSFKQDPKGFGEAILKGIEDANREHREADVGFKGYCNYITVHPSRHADDETVYVHTGNTLFQVNECCEDFQELARRDVKLAKDFIRRAQRILTWAKKSLTSKKV
jgi:hypothetical protein